MRQGSIGGRVEDRLRPPHGGMSQGSIRGGGRGVGMYVNYGDLHNWRLFMYSNGANLRYVTGVFRDWHSDINILREGGLDQSGQLCTLVYEQWLCGVSFYPEEKNIPRGREQ